MHLVTCKRTRKREIERWSMQWNSHCIERFRILHFLNGYNSVFFFSSQLMLIFALLFSNGNQFQILQTHTIYTEENVRWILSYTLKWQAKLRILPYGRWCFQHDHMAPLRHLAGGTWLNNQKTCVSWRIRHGDPAESAIWYVEMQSSDCDFCPCCRAS